MINFVFKVYSSVVFGIVTELCNHIHCLSSDAFITPKETLYLLPITPHSLLSTSSANH